MSIKDEFEFWDLDYLLDVFNGTVLDFIVSVEVDSLKKELEKVNVSSNSKKINIDSVLKKHKRDSGDNYKKIRDMLQVCKDIMPFTKFMMINDCFVPLNENYLRETVVNIRFKYTGKITLIGEYTNNYKGIVQKNEVKSLSQVFNSLDEAVNSFLQESLNIPDYAKVITPIALYFE